MTEIRTDLLGVRVEVWPVAADQHAIWLVSDEHDAWRSDVIPAGSEPHQVAESILDGHDATWRAPEGEARFPRTAFNVTRLLHSTSWRMEGDAVILTWVAVLGIDGYHEATGTVLAPDVWPAAQPVVPALAEVVGKTIPHGPVEPPTPRYIDVLLHGLRHLRFLLDTDDHAQAALNADWQRHLAGLEPALAGMYRW